MKNNMHLFESGKAIKKSEILDKIGTRGTQIMDLASLELPILPGFIIDSDVSLNFSDKDLKSELPKFLALINKLTGKIFGDKDKPLLMKAVISPNMQVSSYPSIHNIGLTADILPGFSKYVGRTFAAQEFYFFLRGLLQLDKKILEALPESKEIEKKLLDNKKSLDAVSEELGKVRKILESKVSVKAPAKKASKITAIEKTVESKPVVNDFQAEIAFGQKLFPAEIFKDSNTQLIYVLGKIRELIAIENKSDGDLGNNDTAILVQAMAYGNFGSNSASGDFFTRNVVTGEKKIQGKFLREQFEALAEGDDISNLEKENYSKLTSLAEKVETKYREIRALRFTIEDGRLWLIEQRVVSDKSTRADLKLLLDLLKLKVIDEKYLIKEIKPSQLNELLHPVIRLDSVKGLKVFKGGIAGAPGAAIGRVYFTTDSMLAAYRDAMKKGDSNPKLILCMPATYANDVKAVELAKGVISCEGGYAAHASVVARQYGKVSLVRSDMKMAATSAKIGDVTLKEGDFISIDVPYYGEPNLYVGKADLIESDPAESGLLEFIAVVKKYVKAFHVRANADTPRDANLALKFGAEGIGLCRTEHMFFAESRINLFREMILAESKAERAKVLKKLQIIQRDDFYQLLKIMQGREVTIRFLDPPLHEFLPHTEEDGKKFLEHLGPGKDGKPKMTLKALMERTEELSEFNPMLGHRGSRLAISYPEIYEMQMNAVVEAAYKLKAEGIDVKPEVMLPVIMSENELKQIIYGKKIEGASYKGLAEVLEEASSKPENKGSIHLKFGTMVEIPAAALGAGKLAKYAEFFSFGTNDLTQTTLGLSRDDFNSFMPDYTQYDLLNGNPFKNLDPNVKDLIEIAVRRGTLTRPNLVKGLCGEHGAVPENIEFCMDAGLNYVSCSPYSVPIANLAIAQYNINRGLV